MIRSSRCLLPCAALALAAAAPLAAQQPLSTGTAAALGGTAVIEARRADAILWNPALIGIWDGPRSSYSLLALDVSRMPSGGWLQDAGRLALLGTADRLGEAAVLGAVLPGDASLPGVSAGIVWGAFQAEDLALSLSTHVNAGAEIPAAHATDPLSRWVARDLEGGTFRSSATVLALTKAGFFGPLPVLGPMWLGATLKGVWVHSFAEGGFGTGGFLLRGERYLCPDADVARPYHCEAAFRNVPGYGIDLGIAFAPWGALRVGAALQNAASGFLRSADQARVSFWEPAGQAVRPVYDAADADTPEFRLAEAVWADLSYPAVLRAGAAYETPVGTLAASVSETVRSGGMQPDWIGQDRFSVSYQGPGAMPLRLTGSFGPQSHEVGGGLQLGRCDRRWTMALGRWNHAGIGTSYSFSASLTFADLNCLQPR